LLTLYLLLSGLQRRKMIHFLGGGLFWIVLLGGYNSLRTAA